MRKDTDETTRGFIGFVPPTKNFFQMPNNWIDISAEIRDISELKIVQYVIRHTWGFHEYGISKTISVDEFMQGRRRQDGSRMDKGTGLSEQSVRNGIKKAVDDGYLICDTDASDAGRIKKSYTLKMLIVESEVQTLDPPQTLDLGTGTNFIPQTPKLYTPDSQTLYPRLPNFIPRTEKDTIERHLKKDNEDTSVSADAEHTRDSFFEFVDELEQGKYTSSEDYPIATPARDTTHGETEHGISDGLPRISDSRPLDRRDGQYNRLLPQGDTGQGLAEQKRPLDEIDDAAYDAFFAPFPPEILTHPGKQAELSPHNVDKQANGVDKPVQDTQKTGKLETPKKLVESPIMPPDDAPWNAETLVQILEARQGRRYPNGAKKAQDKIRDKALRDGRTIIEMGDVDRIGFTLAVDHLEKRKNGWWLDNVGHVMPHHLLKDDKIHTMMDELKRMYGNSWRDRLMSKTVTKSIDSQMDYQEPRINGYIDQSQKMAAMAAKYERKEAQG